jgi:acylphosphatase
VIKCNQVFIRGRVQNVGFRYFAFKTARMLNLSGFVKNESDGSVYIEVEGDEANIQTFIKALEKGPSWARVDHIAASDIPRQQHSDFVVK